MRDLNDEISAFHDEDARAEAAYNRRLEEVQTALAYGGTVGRYGPMDVLQEMYNYDALSDALLDIVAAGDDIVAHGEAIDRLDDVIAAAARRLAEKVVQNER